MRYSLHTHLSIVQKERKKNYSDETEMNFLLNASEIITSRLTKGEMKQFLYLYNPGELIFFDNAFQILAKYCSNSFLFLLLFFF